MGPGLVEQDNKWKVAHRVSKLNKCTYCIGVVEGMLKKLGVSEEDMKYVVEDVEKMKDDERAAVKYAEAVTKDAVEVPEEVYEELKKHYSEDQIVELTAAVGLFNYINRFNDAMGVVPEN
jgi:AhpD family alkylhydroperoxidase